MKVKSESEVAQSCPTLSDPMDCSLPGSSIHGIFQARVLELGAIAFSDTLIIYTLKMMNICYTLTLVLGFPVAQKFKEFTCNAGDPGLVPGLGSSPTDGNGNPLQYSCL